MARPYNFRSALRNFFKFCTTKVAKRYMEIILTISLKKASLVIILNGNKKMVSGSPKKQTSLGFLYTNWFNGLKFY